jgi:DHA2 family multidrug resistance protein
LATQLTQREHFHSQRLGEAITSFSPAVQERLAAMTQAFIAKGVDASEAADKALKAIDGIVRRESYVMAYNDGFFIVAAILMACIVVMWLSDEVKSPSGGGAAAH